VKLIKEEVEVAKVKIHAANFPYIEVSAEGSCIFIKTGVFQFTGETIHASKFTTIEAASEDSVKKVGGAIGWGVVGGVLAGPIGLIAGAILGGNKKDVTFVAEIEDGRKFMATTDSKTFIKLQAAAMKF
jgi:hypothetical protein